jgi:hypothetical protein
MAAWLSIASFRQGGDTARWAAVSTIWIIIPLLVGGLIALVVLIGMIYLMARALKAIPYYTGIAQDAVFKARGYIVRAADWAVKPILVLKGWNETVKAFLERMKP